MENSIEIKDVKKRVIEESVKLFMKYGVKSITMNDIAKECGISKRTLYENFTDKDELLSLCLNMMNAYARAERQILEKSSSDGLDFFIQSVQHLGEKTNQMNPNFYRELNKFYPEIAKQQIEYVENTLFPEAMQLLERGIEEGVFRKDINTNLMTRLLIGQFDYIVNSDFADKVKMPMSEIMQTIILQFVRGIATKKGLKNIEQFATV
jgi:TetR/AcrR family transcriptional regulator, cholesterol catabolism regulator